MNTPKPTLAEIQRELAIIMARMNGKISEDAARVWAHDLMLENITAADLALAGRRLGAWILAPDRGNDRGRVSLEDIIKLSCRARSERLAVASEAPQLSATLVRSPAERTADAEYARASVTALLERLRKEEESK